MRFLVLSLLLCSCGPPPAPHTRYHGELIDPTGQIHACILEITTTALDRIHLHLDYGAEMCDGDGAFITGDVLLPDSGGEITFDEYALTGNFFSATGDEYRMELEVRTARAARPGSGRAVIYNNPPRLPAGG